VCRVPVALRQSADSEVMEPEAWHGHSGTVPPGIKGASEAATSRWRRVAGVSRRQAALSGRCSRSHGAVQQRCQSQSDSEAQPAQGLELT
jgi:hypothetical protein